MHTTHRTDGPSAAAPERVAETVLSDLELRLNRYRQVALPDVVGWERGVDPGYVADLIDYWQRSYDWRPHEARIRAWPWARTQRSKVPVRAIHQRSRRPDATAVLLLHGWPDSVLRFERVLPLLRDVHVMVPSLPGFPFAAPVPEQGMSADAMAGAVASAMAEFGYDRYLVSAGDVGCDVAEALAATHQQEVAALHLTDVSQYHPGLLAWLIEKLRSWTDCEGDLEAVFSRDELLTWVTAYWVSGAIGTSFTPYAVGGVKPERVSAPAVFTIFPQDLVNAPREFAERIFDVRVWRKERAGGHFAAWEQPERYVAGIRDALRYAKVDGDAIRWG